ncbi:hypothetical protein [Ectopseudomonas mendocina]|uniref:hypothetical protein n=1 Tax=Ectopseudomonas mendocina TaxID=300 RepID=UPI00056C4543|nr:hypothetical protein [Pseudomonas mendocina]
MSEHTDMDNSDSVIDAWAIFCLILIAVGTAVFWVSGSERKGRRALAVGLFPFARYSRPVNGEGRRDQWGWARDRVLCAR